MTKPDLTTVLDLRNCYTCGAGNNGNVWTHTIANLGVTQSFGYDAFNRLTSATETNGGFGQSYVYDAFGNRAVTQNSTQLDTPRIPVQNNDGTVPFNANNQWTLATYDPNGTGNQTGVASDTFHYDAENRLRQSTQGSVTATYDYDGEGRRVRKTSASTATIYVYDAMGEVAAEYGGTPAPVSGTSYVAVDTLGSSRAEVDSQGNVTRHDYLPFGQEIPNSWGLRVYYNDYARADGFTRKFTGKERDAETGLDYYGARYLSSVQGRFTGPDKPFADQQVGDPQSWNLYAYVRNNPLRLVDDTGEGTKEKLQGAWQGAKNAANNTMIGFISTVIEPDKVVSGLWNDFKDGVKMLATPEGRSAIAEGWNSLSEQEKAAFVTELGIGVAAVVVSRGGGPEAEAATGAARVAADAAQAEGRARGAAAGLRVGNETFSDVSASGRANHPTVQRVLDNVPIRQRSDYHGACAGIGCLNQAAASGVNPAGGTMRAVKIRKPKTPAHGTPIPPCSSCQHVMIQLDVNHY